MKHLRTESPPQHNRPSAPLLLAVLALAAACGQRVVSAAAGSTGSGGGDAGVDACVPSTCGQILTCGPNDDGCGNIMWCTCPECTCPSGQACIDGGCWCAPKSCAEQGFQCGKQDDGCGGILDCGTCSPGETCGAGGKVGVCGIGACVPKTCQEQFANCGTVTDGCGKTIDCGHCAGTCICGSYPPILHQCSGCTG